MRRARMHAPEIISPDGLWRWNGVQWIPNTVVAPAPPPPWAYPAPAATGGGLSRTSLIALVATLALLGVMIAGVVTVGLHRTIAASPPVRTAGPNPVTSAPGVSSSQGSVVFSDDFQDPRSGWPTGKLPSGTTATYGDGGFVVSARGGANLHLYRSPDLQPLQQLGMRVDATQSVGSPPGSGFGAVCRSDQGASGVRYEFVVTSSGDWFVERRDGSPGAAASARELRYGSSSDMPGSSTPFTLEAVCATLADRTLTRLVLYVNGTQVADLTDVSGGAAGGGWIASLLVSSGDTPSTVVVSRFEERDPSR